MNNKENDFVDLLNSRMEGDSKIILITSVKKESATATRRENSVKMTGLNCIYSWTT